MVFRFKFHKKYIVVNDGHIFSRFDLSFVMKANLMNDEDVWMTYMYFNHVAKCHRLVECLILSKWKGILISWCEWQLWRSKKADLTLIRHVYTVQNWTCYNFSSDCNCVFRLISCAVWLWHCFHFNIQVVSWHMLFNIWRTLIKQRD